MIPHAAANIAATWQDELDIGLETGEAPLFVLGASSSMLLGLPGVLAVEWLDAQRRDGATPWAVAGGTSPLWLLALIHGRPAGTPVRSPATVLAYSGADAATHMAALNIWDDRQSALRRRPAGLPPMVQPDLAPTAHSGSARLAETLPFALAAPNPARRDGWLAWSGVVVALALLLIALLT